MTQPPFSGAPVPVPGVTGGPPVLGGQISNDPNDGSVVVAPNPGNVLQIRKGSQPTSLQVYEYFHTNTDYSRVALNSQNGGPFQLAVETQPPSVIRGLQINAGGSVFINAASFRVNTDTEITGNVVVDGSTIQFPNAASSFSWANGAYLNTDPNDLHIVPPTGGAGLIVLHGILMIGNAFVLSATAGAASALPATPALYFSVKDSSAVTRLIPAYNP